MHWGTAETGFLGHVIPAGNRRIYARKLPGALVAIEDRGDRSEVLWSLPFRYSLNVIDGGGRVVGLRIEEASPLRFDEGRMVVAAASPDGEIVWELTLPEEPLALNDWPTCMVAGAFGYIYVPTGRSIFVLRDTGSIAWRIPVEPKYERDIGSLAAITEQGHLFGTVGAVLLDTLVPSAGLADSPWPTTFGSALRNQRSPGR